MAKKELFKWTAVLVAFVVLFVGVGVSLYMIFSHINNDTVHQRQSVINTSGGSDKETEKTLFTIKNVEEDGVKLTFGSGEVRPLLSPETICVTQTVTATVTPATVADKYVTWSIAWSANAPLHTQNISNYLTITQQTEGSLVAQINCLQSFKGSTAILTCTTRQSNKRAVAEVQFQGAPSSMTISSPNGVSQTNLGRDSVDMLIVGNSYGLNLTLDNVFHDVGNGFSDFTVTVSGVGTVTCGTYVESERGAGWNSHDTVVNFSTIANSFITASVNGYTLNLNVTKSLYAYYASSETHNVEGNGLTTTYTNKLYSLNTDANGNKPYFVITVTHRTLGFSATYNCFISETVNSVALSSNTITF